jgi:hypothetical protein
MTEQELRSIVRDAVARHAAASGTQAVAVHLPLNVVRQHASHALFSVAAGSDSGGPCVIEPSVACNHCGYCRSYGH